MEPWYSDVKCGEIRAITSGISKFVRMRNPDMSGKSGCEMRRNPGNRNGDIGICPDAKLGIRIVLFIPKVIARILKNAGFEMQGNSGNHHRDIRKHPDAKSGEIRICLLLACCLLNNVLEHFQICDVGFFRMFDAEKSGQSPS